ncbi:hypothetical protein [Flavobacterium lacisediminis]|uniref:Uncharacterized protein n=1 Tax=Flavobacterium lacisediminis TaxID=2989705 RepID=A0ABT3EHS0_9FLAO|nr:hypothetical protein [Flavobacterium lacisediminis]MCW1148132.1 hypothetical protein [Flavobacterium lacisediminis]
MKTKFLTIVVMLLLTVSSAFSNNLGKVKVKDFNFSSEINYDSNVEEIWNHELGLKMYVFTMQNSNDLLIAYEDKDSSELTPVAFYQSNSNGFTYKDINNRKEVLTVGLDNGKVVSYNYIEKNDSKYGFALKKCPGGSTFGCIKLSMSACASDGECAFYCAIAGAYCPAAIATACAASCNL